MPVFCDEGVFRTVADIFMSEPYIFIVLYTMLGIFHWLKIFLYCSGQYISGRGLDDVLETSFWETNTHFTSHGKSLVQLIWKALAQFSSAFQTSFNKTVIVNCHETHVSLNFVNSCYFTIQFLQYIACVLSNLFSDCKISFFCDFKSK